MPLDVNTGAFAQIFTRNFCQLAENNHPVPFGHFFLFAGLLIAPALRRGQRKGGNCTAVRNITNFRIRPRFPTRITLLTPREDIIISPVRNKETPANGVCQVRIRMSSLRSFAVRQSHSAAARSQIFQSCRPCPPILIQSTFIRRAFRLTRCSPACSPLFSVNMSVDGLLRLKPSRTFCLHRRLSGSGR